jgi:hypothetical protein
MTRMTSDTRVPRYLVGTESFFGSVFCFARVLTSFERVNRPDLLAGNYGQLSSIF